MSSTKKKRLITGALFVQKNAAKKKKKTLDTSYFVRKRRPSMFFTLFLKVQRKMKQEESFFSLSHDAPKCSRVISQISLHAVKLNRLFS